MKNLKILSVCRSNPRDNAAWWRILGVAGMLEYAGHQIHFAHYCRKVELEKDNLDFKTGRFYFRTSPFTLQLRHLEFLSKNKEYDVVYGNTHAGTYCAILGRITGIPLVLDMHGLVTQELFMENRLDIGPDFLVQYALSRLEDLEVTSMSDMIICGSRKMIDYLHTKRRISTSRMAYVPNGVDVAFFRQVDESEQERLRSELGLEGRLVFGYAGGFQSWQGVEMLLDAAGRSQRENIAFLIVGGYETKRCGNVLFLPRTTRESLLGLYSICDVLVLPRPRNLVTEVAAPTKFVEYLAMGKPVLTTDVGDASLHVRERRCGVVTQSCDASGITVGIEEFANVPRDELVRMGKRSLSLVCDEFDWGRISGNLTTTLRKLVDSK